jgi:glycerol-3-phosphate cytidylyltransferase
MDGTGQKVVLTYGTYDLFHVGHLSLLERLRALGDRLVVGVSTDEFNVTKGKRTIVPYEDRARIVASLKSVDAVIPEYRWEQKVDDIQSLGVSTFGMGDDWTGKFDKLKGYCEVIYLPRTQGISSTELKRLLGVLDSDHVAELKRALDVMSAIVAKLD